MSSTEPYQPDEMSAAISAALDDLIGPVPDEFAEEQPPGPSRPPPDSGVEEELFRVNPTRYGG